MMRTRVTSVCSKVPTAPACSTGSEPHSHPQEDRRAMSPAAPPKHRRCGVMQATHRLYELDPALRDRHRRIEDECRRSIEKGEAQRVWRRTVTIPVVVHVVHKTEEENISDEQVES